MLLQHLEYEKLKMTYSVAGIGNNWLYSRNA